MAEVIFRNICTRKKQTGVVVRSAGTYAEVGSDMMPEAKNALTTNGEKLPKTRHRAVQFTDAMRNGFDHIICFSGELDNVTEMLIPDPYGWGQDAYNIVCRKLQTELLSLYKEIFKS